MGCARGYTHEAWGQKSVDLKIRPIHHRLEAVKWE